MGVTQVKTNAHGIPDEQPFSPDTTSIRFYLHPGCIEAELRDGWLVLRGVESPAHLLELQPVVGNVIRVRCTRA